MRSRTGLSSSGDADGGCRGARGAMEDRDDGRALLHSWSLDCALITSMPMLVFMV